MIPCNIITNHYMIILYTFPQPEEVPEASWMLPIRMSLFNGLWVWKWFFVWRHEVYFLYKNTKTHTKRWQECLNTLQNQLLLCPWSVRGGFIMLMIVSIMPIRMQTMNSWSCKLTNAFNSFWNTYIYNSIYACLIEARKIWFINDGSNLMIGNFSIK